MSDQPLTNLAIQQILAEETLLHSGDLLQVVEQQPFLFARTLLPHVDEVRKNDQMQAGLALRANENDIVVCPYLFRHFCRNGAVSTYVLGTRTIDRSEFSSLWTSHELRRAINRSSQPEMFDKIISSVRECWFKQLSNRRLRKLKRWLTMLNAGIQGEVMNRYQSGEQNLYEMGNAITSVARDLEHQETRWRLEEIGAAVLTDSPLPEFDRAQERQFSQANSIDSRPANKRRRSSWRATAK